MQEHAVHCPSYRVHSAHSIHVRIQNCIIIIYWAMWHHFIRCKLRSIASHHLEHFLRLSLREEKFHSIIMPIMYLKTPKTDIVYVACPCSTCIVLQQQLASVWPKILRLCHSVTYDCHGRFDACSAIMIHPIRMAAMTKRRGGTGVNDRRRDQS